ncbi:hypothetical protein [Streptomyces sp. NPDC059168]|uniref:hypothetical protein n=1 Tax=Streptomyces sp. NPDC059168 TaxID=3346753 RepID=UPI0036A3B314
MAAVILTLAGCGNSATPTGHRATASATAAPTRAEKTASEVLSDVRFASIEFGEARVGVVQSKRMVADHIPPCRIAGLIDTPKVLRKAALVRFTDRLHERGWKLDGAVDQHFTVLKAGGWEFYTGAAPIPAQFREQAGTNRGVITVSVNTRCRRPSPSYQPSQ